MVQGQGRHSRLGRLMEAVTDFGTRTAEQSSEAYLGDEMAEAQKKRSFNFSAGLATLVSVVALLFSGFSFYETVLKQASLRVYAPPSLHMYREGFRDVLAIPITISNDGAQRGTVLSLDLSVKDLRNNKVKRFQSLNFGESPKKNRRLFHPITVPGRSSYTGMVMFHALEKGAFMETTGGVELPLEMTLTVNPDNSGGLFGVKTPKPTVFKMTATYIAGFRDMESGRPTVFFGDKWHSSRVTSGN